MLLTVEGGGFFSSSASGYSKGLALLLLGQKHEDKSMRVSPWNHYQLVDQEPDPDPDLQLASIKNRLSRGCASFVCFGRTSAGLDSPSPLKVGPVQQQDVLPGSFASDKSNDQATQLDDGNSDARKVVFKSSLKKQSHTTQVPLEDGNDREASGEKDGDIPSHTVRRKVQWTDAHGSELAEIREFEPRNVGRCYQTTCIDLILEHWLSRSHTLDCFHIVLSVWPVQSFFTSPLLILYLRLNVSETGGSDDEFSNGSEKTCGCTIM
ncbi:hypothetical protein Goari_023486 [Gossypium aridum]|uniref:Uncharacterized protein n=1 Tax=Gossypium aridum TaxID=34290 RepID=A0A7J8X388_GOSAI|nr:hypothetical protein [Gossypium aridum]